MDPNQTEKVIEPFAIAVIRKAISYGLTALLGWLAAKGVKVEGVDPVAAAVGASAVLGPIVSAVLVRLVEKAIRKYAPQYVGTLTLPTPDSTPKP